MADRNLHNIEVSLNGIERALTRLERKMAPTPIEPIRTQSGTLEHQIPIELDWTPAPIKTEATFIKRADGKVTIVIEVVGEDADILLESIPDTPVEYLQLSALAR